MNNLWGIMTFLPSVSLIRLSDVFNMVISAAILSTLPLREEFTVPLKKIYMDCIPFSIVVMVMTVAFLPKAAVDFILLVLATLGFLYGRSKISMESNRFGFVLSLVVSYAIASNCISIVLVSNHSSDWLYVAAPWIMRIVTAPFVYLLIRKLIYPMALRKGTHGWRWIWIIPLIFAELLVLTVRSFQASYENWVYYSVSIILITISDFVTCTALIYLCQKEATISSLTQKEQFIKEQMQLQQAEYKKLLEEIQEIKIAKNDLRHQVLLLEKSTRNAQESLEPAQDIYCQHMAVNAVIRYYSGRAAEEGVPMECEMEVPAHIDMIEDMDLCALLGNLVENALEASRYIVMEERRVKVVVRLINSYMSVMVENTFDGYIKNTTDGFMSRKRERLGVGTLSVGALVKKYGGVLDFKIEDKIFRANILLKMKAVS
ncbi:MAG: ATP-binding protein [Lachnospiraceae bacterium]